MAAEGAIRVTGLAQLQRVFAVMGKDAERGLRKDLRKIAEPVRVKAAGLSRSEVSHIGDRWARARLGVSGRAVVYVVPTSRRRGGSPRPNLGALLQERAYQPALEQSQGEVVRGVEAFLDDFIRAHGF